MFNIWSRSFTIMNLNSSKKYLVTESYCQIITFQVDINNLRTKNFFDRFQYIETILMRVIVSTSLQRDCRQSARNQCNVRWWQSFWEGWRMLQTWIRRFNMDFMSCGSNFDRQTILFDKNLFGYRKCRNVLSTAPLLLWWKGVWFK